MNLSDSKGIDRRSFLPRGAATAAAAIAVTRLGAQPSAPDRKEIEVLLTKANIATRAGVPERKLVKNGGLPQTVSSGALPPPVNLA